MTTHELGHVLGFNHEHQRPDAANYMRFNCPALSGYEAAVRSVARAKDASFTDGDTVQQRMDQVCSSPTLAYTYFPIALAYIPGAQKHRNDPRIYTPKSAGAQFDHRSIMLYGSDSGVARFDWDDRSTWAWIHTQDTYPDYKAPLRKIVQQAGGTD